MRKLYKSKKDRIICGICSGLGDFFRLDPSIIRLVLIFICIITGLLPVIIAYLILCIVIPLEPANYRVKPYKRLYRSKKNKKMAGICAGISKMFKIDVTIVRVICVILAFISFGTIAVSYVIGWVIIPEDKDEDDYIEIEIDKPN